MTKHIRHSIQPLHGAHEFLTQCLVLDGMWHILCDTHRFSKHEYLENKKHNHSVDILWYVLREGQALQGSMSIHVSTIG